MKRWIIGFTLIAAVAPAWAIYSAPGVDNATVQPGGPRSGANGKRFLNMEGNDNGAFASYGIVDVNAADLAIPFTVGDISNVTLTLYNAPAGFSRDGNIKIYITEDTAVDIQPGTSPLKWDANTLPEGINPADLNPRHELGTGFYDSTLVDGHPFVYNLTVNGAAKTYLIGQINADAKIRLVITPLENGCAATYSGYTDTIPTGESAAPILSLDATQGGGGPVIAHPDSFNIVFGSLISGNVASLSSSDDSHLRLRNGNTFLITQSPITVEFVSDSAANSATAITFVYEGRVSLGGLVQRLDMFKYATNSYVQVDQRNAPTGSDQVVTVNVTSGAGDYMNGTGGVKSRLRVKDDTPAFLAAWDALADLVEWQITE